MCLLIGLWLCLLIGLFVVVLFLLACDAMAPSGFELSARVWGEGTWSQVADDGWSFRAFVFL